MSTSQYGCIGEAAGTATWQRHCAPVGGAASAGVRRPGPRYEEPFYLTATVPPGPRQAQEAEKIKTRFLNQVDEGRNPKTRANVGQLIVKYFEVVDVDVLTLRGYRLITEAWEEDEDWGSSWTPSPT